MANKGLTLIELLITVAILGILIIIGMMSWRNQVEKARDARKKDDLQRLSVAFEEYYSDWNCYPPSDVLNDCGSDALGDYLQDIPCDKVTGRPYCYVTDPTNPTCFKNFRIMTPLKTSGDPVITALGCNGSGYCGWETECADLPSNIYGFNYGVSSKNITVANPTLPSPEPEASQSPEASPRTDYYWCQGSGNCTSYDPLLWNCNPNYTDPNCTGSNGCSSAGSCQQVGPPPAQPF